MQTTCSHNTGSSVGRHEQVLCYVTWHIAFGLPERKRTIHFHALSACLTTNRLNKLLSPQVRTYRCGRRGRPDASGARPSATPAPWHPAPCVCQPAHRYAPGVVTTRTLALSCLLSCHSTACQGSMPDGFVGAWHRCSGLGFQGWIPWTLCLNRCTVVQGKRTQAALTAMRICDVHALHG